MTSKECPGTIPIQHLPSGGKFFSAADSFSEVPWSSNFWFPYQVIYVGWYFAEANMWRSVLLKQTQVKGQRNCFLELHLFRLYREKCTRNVLVVCWRLPAASVDWTDWQSDVNLWMIQTYVKFGKINSQAKARHLVRQDLWRTCEVWREYKGDPIDSERKLGLLA